MEDDHGGLSRRNGEALSLDEGSVLVGETPDLQQDELGGGSEFELSFLHAKGCLDDSGFGGDRWGSGCG